MKSIRYFHLGLAIFLLCYSMLCMYLSVALGISPGSKVDLVCFLLGCTVMSFFLSTVFYFKSKQYN